MKCAESLDSLVSVDFFLLIVRGGGGDLEKFSWNGVTKDMMDFIMCTSHLKFLRGNI